jgi:hypothetical protein
VPGKVPGKVPGVSERSALRDGAIWASSNLRQAPRRHVGEDHSRLQPQEFSADRDSCTRLRHSSARRDTLRPKQPTHANICGSLTRLSGSPADERQGPAGSSRAERRGCGLRLGVFPRLLGRPRRTIYRRPGSQPSHFSLGAPRRLARIPA